MSQVKPPIFDVPIYNPSNYEQTTTTSTVNNTTTITKGFTFNGSTTFVSWGDSYGDNGGIGWNSKLATLSGKTLINNNVSGTTTEYPMAQSVKIDLILANSYDSYSHIIMYGVNDYRNTSTALYSCKNPWKEAQLNLILSACLPSSVKSNPRSASWTKISTANIPIFTTWGINITADGGYIESSLTGRYLLISEIIDTGTTQYKISINGVDYKYVTKVGYSGYNSYVPRCSVFDLGTIDTRTIRITRIVGGNTSCYITYVACFNSSQTGNKNVLISNVPYLPISDSNSSRMQREHMSASTLENVNYCKSTLGLNVYLYAFASFYTNQLSSTDALHPTSDGYLQIATDIFTNYIS
jgi:hypothetical protein